jgi:hypothetical protein
MESRRPRGGNVLVSKWTAQHVKCLGVRLADGVIGEWDENGQPIVGETIQYLLGGNDTGIDSPQTYEADADLEVLVDTIEAQREAKAFPAGGTFQLGARDAAVLQGVPA